MRQLGGMPFFVKSSVDAAVKERTLGKSLDIALTSLASLLGCQVSDLQLDHDPALENREKLVEMPDGYRRRTVVVPKGAKVLRYFPDANDQEHLFYRPHAATFAGSHKVKTNVRGDRGQHSDRALAAKNKNIEKNRAKKKPGKSATKPRGFELPSKPLASRPFALNLHKKTRVCNSPIRSGNRWPPKGSRPFRRKP